MSNILIKPETDVRGNSRKDKNKVNTNVNIGVTNVIQLQLDSPQLNLIGRALTGNMRDSEKEVAYELGMSIVESKLKFEQGLKSQAESILEHLKKNNPYE